jgi:tRNA (Thr-GGU) A37 N-methylase
MNQICFELIPVGWVESPLTDRASAPKQAHEGSPEAWLVFEPWVLPGLEGIQHPLAGSPQPDRASPREIVSIDGHRFRVRNLEALHDTPIVDVKPARP